MKKTEGPQHLVSPTASKGEGIHGIYRLLGGHGASPGQYRRTGTGYGKRVIELARTLYS